MKKLFLVSAILAVVVLGCGKSEEEKKAEDKKVEKGIEALKHEDFTVRFLAAKLLGKIGDKKAIEPLIEALKDKDEGVRILATNALRKITSKNFGTDYDKWLKWWKENKDRLKEEEPEKEISPELKKKIESLIKKLGSDKFKEREEAQKELIKIGKPAIPFLKEALKSDDIEVRFRATKILETLGLDWPVTSAEESTITKKLKKKYEDLIKTLKPKEFENSYKKLVKLLGSKSPKDREKLARILGELGDKNSIPILTKLLKDSNVYVRIYAAISLSKFKEKSLAYLYLKLTEDKEVNIRCYGANGLGDVGGNLDQDSKKYIISRLKVLLKSQHPAEVHSVYFALRKLGVHVPKPDTLKKPKRPPRRDNPRRPR